MKTAFSTIILVIFCCFPWSAATGDQWSDQQITKIDRLPEKLTSGDVVMLSKLAGLSNRTNKSIEVINRAFERLCSQPEFDVTLAQYIRDEKSKWKSGGDETYYNSSRYQILDALGRIPDPRSIRALGEFLDDMEWTRDPVEHLMSGADYSITGPNGILAAMSLGRLISESPVEKSPDNYLEQDIEPWREWYHEVKSGSLAFSFKGKDIEYRFNPDGTWSSSMLKNLRRFPHDGTPKEKKDAPATPGIKQTAATPGIWPWILGGMITVLALLSLWLIKRPRSEA